MERNLKAIHKSLINENIEEMVEQIDEYGAYDFFSDYYKYLENLYVPDGCYHFVDAVVSYHRIKEGIKE